MSNTPIVVHRCRAWSEFKITLREHLSPDSKAIRLSDDWLFRGVEDADWELKSSFGRKFGWPKPDPAKRGLKKCSQLLSLFRDACAAESDVDTIKNDVLEMLAFAQHYELPTPTLDWSESPYIAAHFAYHLALCNSPKDAIENLGASSQMVAIWALNKTDTSIWAHPPDRAWIRRRFKKKEGKFNLSRYLNDKVLLFESSKLHNQRLHRQRGWLTYQVEDQDPLDRLVAKRTASGPILWKFELPLKDAPSALSDLHDMRINRMELMPDHAGRARHALERAILTSP